MSGGGFASMMHDNVMFAFISASTLSGRYLKLGGSVQNKFKTMRIRHYYDYFGRGRLKNRSCLVCGHNIRTNNVQRFRCHADADNILRLTFYHRILIASRHIEYFLPYKRKIIFTVALSLSVSHSSE